MANRSLTRTDGRSTQRLLPVYFSALRSAITRDEMIAGLCILACANGFYKQVFISVHSQGWINALIAAFDVSTIVWVACFAGLAFLLRNNTSDELRPLDLAVGAGAFALIVLPFARLSWCALSVLTSYSILTSRANSARRSGSLILFSLTVPMCWGPKIVDILAPWLLAIDAMFVSFLIGTERIGNVVGFTDGVSHFQIWPGCSAFHNISLLLVLWITVARTVGRRWSVYELGWCALIVLATYFINAIRLALIGSYKEYFEILHGPIGGAVAGWVSLCVAVAICFLGNRNEIAARA